MIHMNDKGQISAEYILMLGFLVVVVLLVASYAGEQNEQNSVVDSVRQGASSAVTELSILNRTLQPVRVNGINMTSGTDITITINLSDSSLNTQQEAIILQGSKSSLENQGFTVTENGNPIQNLTFNTSRHNYLVKVA
jgi:uncharacterized protein (UPF0333 family)